MHGLKFESLVYSLHYDLYALRVIKHSSRYQSGFYMPDHLSLKLQLKDELTVASPLMS